MPDEITPELFAHLVNLASLDLEANQAEYLRSQLNSQLKAIHELEAIPLGDDVKATIHGVPFPVEISPELRQDIWQPFSDPLQILSQAPQFEDGYIIVPEIPHTTLE
jgi:aspartyl-tRNA(Asn)/glutamyl-tRNA(Gln) amidotransferase subunit C